MYAAMVFCNGLIVHSHPVIDYSLFNQKLHCHIFIYITDQFLDLNYYFRKIILTIK